METSTYGSELVETGIAVEIIMEYYYKLRMIGVPVLRMLVINRENMAVITNTSSPGTNIKRKHHTCTYHFIKKAEAAGIVCFVYKPSKQNWTDALTKALPPHLLYNMVKAIIFYKVTYTAVGLAKYGQFKLNK